MTKLQTKLRGLKKTTKVDFATYLGVIVVFIAALILQSNGLLNRKAMGLLVPICCYMSMAVSLNLTVGILGELSLGHAGFMSVGAFSGVIAAQSLQSAIPNDGVRLAAAMLLGRVVSGIAKALIFSAGSYSMASWVAGSFVTALPGIVIQLALLPSIVYALMRARLIPQRYPKDEE